MTEYRVQPGDTFYLLAQRIGGSWQDFVDCNPGIDPNCLQVGQAIILPKLNSSTPGKEQYAEISLHEGQNYSGDHLDDVEMEIEGVRFRVKRIGESRIPHEVHLTVPRTEIRKIQPQGENGPCEVQIMLSNVNIIHSPRLMSERPYSQTSSGDSRPSQQPQDSQLTQGPSQPTPTTQAQGTNAPLAQVNELRYDIRPDLPRPINP